MYGGGGSSGTPVSTTRERLPNFLLSPLGGAGASSGAPSSSSPTPMATSPAFNARLRPADAVPSGGQSNAGSGTGDSHRAQHISRDSPASPFDRRSTGAGFGQHHGTSHTPSSSRKPPTRSLLDSGPGVMSIHSPSPELSRSYTPSTRMISPATPNSRMGLFSPGIPDEKESVNGADRWITVFGFPAAMEGTVLKEFKRHGEVLRTMPGRGNWLHILYRTSSQAQVALHRPWRLVAGGTIMVGATDCTEPDACVSAAEQMDPERSSAVLIASPSNESSSLADTGAAMSTPIAAAGTGLRTPKSLLRTQSPLSGRGYQTPLYDQQQPGTSLQNASASPGPSSILRPPSQPRGILGMLSDYMSGA